MRDYNMGGGYPVIALRQCVDCRWLTKVFGAEFELPLPEPKQALRDIAGWREERVARERAKAALAW